MNPSEILKIGDKLFFNESNALSFIKYLKPGTRDDFTHYIYFNKNLGLFFEYSNEDMRENWIDISRVEQIVESLAKEQRRAKEYMESLDLV